MARKAVSRSSISLGLVSIPVELFAVTRSNSVRFDLLQAER
jgi:non-homologous end joining protein Ku